jgi:multidrug efflux pump subunit AcrA (membrane-fusion protein)
VVFYTADIRLDQNYVGDDSAAQRLLPGMSIQADIITGTKSVLRYLLKPVYASLGSAFSER